MSKRATQAAPASDAASPWIQNPAVDLIVGCGAWSAPLLLLSYFLVRSYAGAWAIAFYLLALFFNYPHYMATIYRAYHTAEDFRKYRTFTVHITGLVLLTALLSHFYVGMLPWIFTLYLTWSPWHYSGQNYGLFMMFARRAGASPSQLQRRALYSVFLLTYIVLFLNLHTGSSRDPLFVSLNLPAEPVRWATVGLALVCVGLSAIGLQALYKQVGARGLLAPLTLLSTQYLWFLIPSLLSVSGRFALPQGRYSTGVMAIMHSAQYLWITSYYARREASGSKSGWRPWAYFLVLTAGGIALFIPGPWLASYVFHFDFTSSFLIFTALVNLHHFILDGAIWKLRDGRIANLLLHSQASVTQTAADAGGALLRFAHWTVSPNAGARALRIGSVGALLMLATLDQTRFVLGSNPGQRTLLQRAAALNPYDGTMQAQVARDEAAAGHADAADAAFLRASAERPNDSAIRDQYLQFLISQKRFNDAFQLTNTWMERTPKDANLLVDRGILANSLGNADEARASWENAVAVDPHQLNAHLYLAELLSSQGRPELAVPHYERYLEAITKVEPAMKPPPKVVVTALLHMADCLVSLQRGDAALRVYDSAEQIAASVQDAPLQSLVAGSAADFQEQRGNFAEAVRLYQQALRVDSAASTELESADLISYAQLLHAHHFDPMAYACLLRAEKNLSSNQAAPEFAAADKTLKRIESSSPAAELAAVRRDPEGALKQALALLN